MLEKVYRMLTPKKASFNQHGLLTKKRAFSCLKAVEGLVGTLTKCLQLGEGSCEKDMGVSKNNGTPKSSVLIGFSIINHPFWGTPIFGNTHMIYWYTMFFWSKPRVLFWKLVVARRSLPFRKAYFQGGTVSFRECIQLIQSYKKTQSFLRAWKRFIERLPANHPNFQSVDSSQKPGSQYGLIPNPCLSHGRSCKGL